jgi:hypothetical protein
LLATAVFRCINKERKRTDLLVIDYFNNQQNGAIDQLSGQANEKSFADPKVKNEKGSCDAFTREQASLLQANVAPDARGLNQHVFICVATHLATRGGKDMRATMAQNLVVKFDPEMNKEYVEQITGDVSKTKKGGLKELTRKTFQNKHSFASHDGERSLSTLCNDRLCFPCVLKLAKSKRSADANPALFLQPKKKFSLNEREWFLNTPVGHNILQGLFFLRFSLKFFV